MRPISPTGGVNVSKPIILAALVVMTLLVYGCSEPKSDGGRMHYRSIGDVPASVWKQLGEKRIYFGHQSVGQNIMEGVRDVLQDNPQILLKVSELKDSGALHSPMLAHSAIGSNEKPESKIEAFSTLMERNLGSSADIAFFKFCYIDFSPVTDVEKLFLSYRRAVDNLQSKYTNTTFIHVTVPLVVLQKGPKAWIKTVLGKPISGYDDNVKRCQFNDMLREEYGGKSPLFDLASIESTYPDSKRASFEKDGHTYYHLIDDYAYDDGHLNKKGRIIVAEQLLVFLAGI
jgi:hypothetical protein